MADETPKAAVSAQIADLMRGKPAPTEAPAQAPATSAPEPLEMPADIFEETQPTAPVIDTADIPAPSSKEDHAWSEVKHANKQLQTDNSALKKRLEELESKAQEVDVDSVKSEYEQRLAEYEKKLAQYSIIESPAFRKEFDEPIQVGVAKATRILTQNAGFEQAQADTIIRKALNLPFDQRNRYLLDEAPELHGILSNVLLDVSDGISRRKEAIDKAEATKVALKDSEVRQKQATSVKQVNESVAESVAVLADEGNAFYRRSRGTSPKEEAWNRSIEANAQAVTQILLKNDHKEITKLVADGFTAHQQRRLYAQSQQEVANLKKQLADMTAVRPDVSMRGGAGEPRAAKPEISGLNVAEQIAVLMRNS